MNEPRKLTAGEIHILKLIRKGSNADGWAPVSKAVKPLFTDKKIPGGTMPEALCEFEPVGDAGRARLTTRGSNLLDAMAWL